MKEYLLTLVGVVIFSGVIVMIGAEDGAKKYIRLVCSLSVLCMLISPLTSLLRGGELSFEELWDDVQGEDQNYDEIYKDNLASHEMRYVEELLKKNIQSEFSLSSSDVDVRIKSVSKNGIYEVESVGVILRDRAVLADPKEIASLINSKMGCPCTIVYD